MEVDPTVILRIVYVAASLFMLSRIYKNRFGAWIEKQRGDIDRAAEDETFRKSELADTETLLAQLPIPDHITPVTRKQDARLRTFPMMEFTMTLAGLGALYLGIFHAGNTVPVFGHIPPGQAGGPFCWLGAAMLAAALLVHFLVQKARTAFARVHLLTRKYMLQKVVNDASMLETLDQIQKYYPDAPEMWLERAERHAAAGEFEAAVKAIRTGGEKAPGVPDFAVGEASYQLRQNNTKGAEKAVQRIETMRRNASDPRLELYQAAIALQKGNKKKAQELGNAALAKDKRSANGFLHRDPALADLKTLLENPGT